jgi:hypothetical protein
MFCELICKYIRIAIKHLTKKIEIITIKLSIIREEQDDDSDNDY